MNFTPRIQGGVAWLLVGAFIALPAAVVGVADFESPWALRPSAGWEGNPLASWWTPAWGHATAAHLQANLLGCALMTLLGVLARVPRSAALAWLCAWPCTHALLLLDPRLTGYLGASGVLHAAAAIVGVALWRGGQRPLAAVWLAALAAKVLHDLSQGLPVFWHPDLGLAVSPLAHATGAASGLVFAGFLGAGRPQKS